MKRFLTFFTLLIPALINAQKFDGMIKVEQNLWVDATEVTNKEYKTFLNSLPEKKKTKYTPDSTVFLSIDTAQPNILDSTIALVYFNHPDYNNYPVVGITYGQMVAYCEWRSKTYNKNSKKLKVEFTLPTEEEWNSIASEGGLGGYFAGTITHPTRPGSRKEIKFMRKNGFLVNCLDRQAEIMKQKPVTRFSVAVDHTFSSGKIHGLSGNVAEVTVDQKVKGGSFDHPAAKCQISETIEWDPSQPSAWLGFRCIVKIKKEKR